MKQSIKVIAVVAFTFAAIISSVVLPVKNASAIVVPCTASTFSSGSSSTCVTYIQVLSNSIYTQNPGILGGNVQLTTDGKFGPKTRSAIDNLQAHTKLQTNSGKWTYLTADGVVGPMTWFALCHLPFLHGTGIAGTYVSNVAASAGCARTDSSYKGWGLFIPVVY